MSYQFMETLKTIAITLGLSFTTMFVVVMYINKKLFETELRNQLKRIVERKYTSRKLLEKDIKTVYDLYAKEEEKRGISKIDENI